MALTEEQIKDIKYKHMILNQLINTVLEAVNESRELVEKTAILEIPTSNGSADVISVPPMMDPLTDVNVVALINKAKATAIARCDALITYLRSIPDVR